MSTTEEQLPLLFTALYQIRVLNYVTLSSAAFLVYDVLINLDKEVCHVTFQSTTSRARLHLAQVHFIWRYYHNTDETPISWPYRLRRILVQALFIFGRYYGLLYLVVYFVVYNHYGLSVSLYAINIGSVWRTLTVSSGSCQGFYYYYILAGEILYTTLVNIILVMRLNALYRVVYGMEGLKKYQFFLAAVVITELVIELSTSISAATWSHDKVVEPPAGVPWPGCLLSESPNNTLMLPGWIVAILVATTLFGLTLHLLFSSMRWRLKSFRDLTISNIKEEIRSIQPTTQMLIRDSVLFYIPILAMLVASVVVVSTVYNSFL
ncbi:hypothetical protein EDC04DRAFT_3139279 [Pisolithus marmoratus]|nr:hypothetical protein EDC04DRAFT_3139279 [Pisolithus marmoratus]